MKKHLFNIVLVLSFSASFFVNNFYAGIVCGSSFTLFVIYNVGKLILFTAIKSIDEKVKKSIQNNSTNI